jgi:uncharacterized protein involved in outer membrane biogenesis
MKKILAVVFSLIATVILVLLVVPLFYSLDDVKPRIEQAANAKLRGEVKLGHMSFSLFPNVKVGVEDVQLFERKGAGGEPFGKISKLEIRMSLLSLLSSPKATFRLNGLDLNHSSSEEKGDNLKNFLPDAPVEPAPTDAEALADEANPLAAVQKNLAVVLVDVPGFIRNRILTARFSFEILESHVSSKLISKDSAISADLKDLRFQIFEIGFNSPIQVSSSAVMNVGMDGIKVEGPFALDGELTLIPSKGESSELKFSLKQNLDNVAISALGLLDKKAGTAMGGELGGSVKFGKVIDADISTLSFQFGGIKTAGSLGLRAEKLEESQIDLKILSEKIDLAGLGALVPLVRDFKLKGQSDFAINMKGAPANPSLDIRATLSGVSGATPQLAKPISDLKGQLTVSGNLEKPLVALKDFSMKIGRSDLAMTMTSEGLAKISAKVNVTSNLLDGDELMGVEPVAASGKAAGGASPTTGSSAPAVDPNASLDEVLDEMAPLVEESLKNEMLDRISLVATMNLKKIRFAGAEYTNATAEAKLASRKMTIKTGNMGAYGGSLQADMDLVLKPSILEYGMKAKMDKIQMAEAVKAHAPLWKDSMTGSLVGSMSLSGQGLRKAQLAEHLRGNAQGSMENGRLNLPVMKLVTMFISKLPKQAGDKLDDQEFRGDFKTMKFAADIKGRTIFIKELNVVYDPQKAKIGELRFASTGELSFDRQIKFDATAFVSPELIRVAELKGPSGLVEIPMKLTGTMQEPKPDIGYTTKILTERYAKGTAKREIEKLAPKVIDKITEKAPEPLKKELDKLKKKFKF